MHNGDATYLLTHPIEQVHDVATGYEITGAITLLLQPLHQTFGVFHWGNSCRQRVMAASTANSCPWLLARESSTTPRGVFPFDWGGTITL